ncbi:small acid-soluble spore protein SspI [Siminovitchia acidinfaciens]|uniref:Small, acid-soluble spore protein I n=1 Tax=Siminovitchia acidinfaciens TaxID=2321395 RepID=A0A429Y4H6_9BACI|nr:small acid-soluble spore protein SspI [Siminovitchia acidinfaciens]RST76332.1 small acid-soluble spore protein SspI [Siminovitchia acidinfaciens]
MDINIRRAVIHNVSENNQEQLRDTIVDAMQKGEEKYLPGLGVLFEVIWEHSDEQEKVHMLGTLESGLKQE